MWANSFERNAESKGYKMFSTYNTKEEADEVMKVLRSEGVRCFKAHHKNNMIGFDMWLVWVKGFEEKFRMLSEDEKNDKR